MLFVLNTSINDLWSSVLKEYVSVEKDDICLLLEHHIQYDLIVVLHPCFGLLCFDITAGRIINSQTTQPGK